MAVTARWLSSTAAGLAIVTTSVFHDDRPTARKGRAVMGAVLATAILVSVAPWGRGLGATFGPGSDGSIGSFTRLALALHLVAFLVAVGLAAPQRKHWSSIIRQPHEVVFWFWVVAVVIERGVHLLDESTFRDQLRGTYRPPALVAAVHVPLVAALSFVVAIGWSLMVRPQYERRGR